MINETVDWMFDTTYGRIVGLCLMPLVVPIWLVVTMFLGEDFFSWIERRQKHKDCAPLHK